MKLYKRNIQYAIAVFVLLACISCKTTDRVEPEPVLGSGEYLLRSIYGNGTLSDSFVYNSKGQVIKYLSIPRSLNATMTYNNEGRLTDAAWYVKRNEAWILLDKFSIFRDAGGMTVYDSTYDIINGTSKIALDTMLFTLDQEERFTNLVYSSHVPDEFHEVFFFTSRRKYTNHQLTTCEMKIFVYPNNPGTPNSEEKRLSLDYTVNYEYGDVPNKLYALGKSNPFLMYTIGEDNNLFAGNMQVKSTTRLGSNVRLETTEKTTSVFTDTYYPNTAYLKNRKVTGTSNKYDFLPYNIQYYYTPAP
jgi:hypothetical protein